jgi:hypothetical protein
MGRAGALAHAPAPKGAGMHLGERERLHVDVIGFALRADVGDHDQDGQGLACGVSLADACEAVR